MRGLPIRKIFYTCVGADSATYSGSRTPVSHKSWSATIRCEWSGESISLNMTCTSVFRAASPHMYHVAAVSYRLSESRLQHYKRSSQQSPSKSTVRATSNLQRAHVSLGAYPASYVLPDCWRVSWAQPLVDGTFIIWSFCIVLIQPILKPV